MKYIEIGIGNESFISTEIEENGREYRIRGWHRLSKIEDLYLRCWIGKTVWVLSSRDGLKKMFKRRKYFKLLIGIAG